MIADYNGMTSDSELAAGMTLKIPNEVHNLHYNSTTFRPYDPNKAVGNTSPTTPKPVAPEGRPKEKCGGLGDIIVAAVTFAVAWVVFGPLAAVIGQPAAFVASAAIGSAVGQEAGIAMGVQDHFSWNAVAFAAVSAAVTMGMGAIPGLDKALGPLGTFGGDVVRGALGNVVTQGIAVATGMQEKFDWTGVAVAGVTAGFSGAVSDALAGNAVGAASKLAAASGGDVMGAAIDAATGPMGVGGAENAMLSGMAGLMAGAATRSVLEGDRLRRQHPGRAAGRYWPDAGQPRRPGDGSRPLPR